MSILTVIFVQKLYSKNSKVLAKEYDLETRTFRMDIEEKFDSSIINLDILNNSVALFGREFWNEGEIISFNINSNSNTNKRLKLGIVELEETDDNNYKLPITKEIEIRNETKELEFIVPNSANYGIIIIDSSNSLEFKDLFKPKSKEMVIDEINDKAENSINEKTLDEKFPNNEKYFHLRLEINIIFETEYLK